MTLTGKSDQILALHITVQQRSEEVEVGGGGGLEKTKNT